MKKILSLMLALFAIATTAGAQNKINGHEYVDLGLPSGLLWATCNVGADKPEEYGDYFAWGETTPKETYSWDNYKWCKGTLKTLIKYCGNSEYGYEGFTDGKTVLDPEDDAATAKWGGKWRMPTLEEFTELKNNTESEKTEMNGVKGWKITSKINGNSIFLPYAGIKKDTYLGEGFFYWSSSLRSDVAYIAYFLYEAGGLYAGGPSENRHNGCNVRPVWSPNIAINATNFPDANFRSYLLAQSYGKDAILTDEEIAAVKTLVVANKKITDLKGIEFFAALETFSCYTNQLTSLNVSANKKLTKLDCSENKISITEMQVLVDGLPTVTRGLFYAIDTGSSNEGNVITKSQVNIAKGKGWIVYSWHNGSNPTEYEGIDDPTTDPKTLAVTFTKAVTPVSELSTQDINALSAIIRLAEKGKLNGYSVEIQSRIINVLKKGTKILFVADSKEITVPDDVTSDDNIYVELTEELRQALLGTTLTTPLASYDALQVKFDIDTTTAIDAPLNDNGEMTNDSWYTIDGVKLSGEPTRKGIYIRNGKKVVK